MIEVLDMNNQRKPSPHRPVAVSRGVALIVVLSAITIALALSYAMLRGQTTQLIVQQNSTRTLDARQAAVAGMNLALQKMHESSWAGVGTVFAGNLDAESSYSVTFTTGDESLAEGDADYDDYPYRVTLLSTGTAADAVNGVSATHQIQTVVQLVPRKLSDAPSGSDVANDYVLYQWGNNDVQVDLPCHIDGPAYLSGALELAQSYPYDAKPFDGTIDEVAIYDDEYGSSEVKNVYRAATGQGAFGNLTNAYNAYSPIAWWRLDDAAGSTIAVDVMGSHDGKYVEADPGVLGKVANAAQFDGVDDFIDAGAVDVSGDTMTIFAWVKADSFGTEDTTIISKAVAQGDADHYWVLGTTNVGGNTRLKACVRTDLGLLNTTAWSGSLVAGQWYFVALVVDSNNDLRLYLDGTPVSWVDGFATISKQPYAQVFIGDDMPGSSRGQFLRDLNAKQEAGFDDERPLTGPVSLPESEASANSLRLLQENLGVTTNNVTPTYSSPGTFPTSLSAYQLYTGGKKYSVESISMSFGAASHSADPKTNPLGIFRVTGSAMVSGDAAIEGTLIVEQSGSFGGGLNIQGTGNSFAAVDLPAIYGTSDSVQLPTVITETDVVAATGTESVIKGMVWVGGAFQLAPKKQDGLLEIEGAVVAHEVQLQGNSFWQHMGEAIWQDAVALHQLQDFGPLDYSMNSVANWSLFIYSPDQTHTYLPDLIESALASDTGLMDPALTLKAESTPVSYHWHDWSEPIYVPHPDDGGLRWDLIDWNDNP